MTGFKSGASDDDPLAGDDDGGDSSSQQETNGTPATETLEATESARQSGKSGTDESLPWIYRRNSITDGRDKTVQLHLQRETLNQERNLVGSVEQQLGESVKKADVREAAYIVAMSRVDEVADQLREWGYDA